MSGPSFRKPPAIERVLSVQFRELAGFDLVHYGMWFDRIRSDFPLSTRQERLLPIVEQFPQSAGQRHARIGIEVGVPLGRCVFSSRPPSTRLLQLQPDRFAMNWRRQAGDDYLRFPQTSERFEQSFQEFSHFCSEFALPEPIVELCEVTYVNRIACPDDTSAAEFSAQVFGEGILGGREEWLPAPSGFSVNRRFDFPDEKGRLYAEAASAEDQNGRFLLLKMIGRTVTRNDDRWQERMNLAHDWVVNGFKAITEESIRYDIWEQCDD
jgi:uncharacterized protein (TIGR04255 family)